MGCSSSALNKAGDSSRFGSSGVPSNENSSTVEQNKFCVAQPKPCTPGGEAAFRGNTQRESRPPLERPKASVVPTANGVKSYHQPSLANDETPAKEATDHSRPLKKIEPLVQGGECELPQPGGKDDTLGTEDVKNDVEARTEIQSLKGNAETEPLRMAAERGSPGAGEDTKLPQAGMMKFLHTTENILPLETAQELLPEEAMRKDAQPQILEAIPKENSSPEILEGYEFVGKVEQKELQEIPRKDMEFQLLETIPKENSSPEIAEGSQSAESSEKQQLSEAPGETEQPQGLEIVLKENETPLMPDRSQLVPTPVTNKSLGDAPDGGRSAHESHPQVTGGNGLQPAETSETAAKVEMARELHPDKEEEHIEGETGEKVEAEMKNEKESEEAETKEKETGEAVDLGAAGASDRRA